MSDSNPTKRTYTRWDWLGEEVVKHARGRTPDTAWMQWPDQETWKKGRANVYRSRVKSGQQWGPGFDAATRKGVLWVRYLGDSAPTSKTLP